MIASLNGLCRLLGQAREIELHEAYAKLTAGAMERGKMRAQLINTEVCHIICGRITAAVHPVLHVWLLRLSAAHSVVRCKI